MSARLPSRRNLALSGGSHYTGSETPRSITLVVKGTPVSVPQMGKAKVNNRLLRSLPAEDYQRLLPHLEPVSLRLSRVLCEPGESLAHAYFVTQGAVCLLASTPSGETIEVGVIGNEGMIGVPVLFGSPDVPCQLRVQVAGTALRIPMPTLKKEFGRGGALHDRILCFTNALIVQFAQSNLCNHYHRIEERLCRWLLILHDYSEADTVQMTQELIAHMLGVRRTGVSLVAGMLQTSGLISYRRGRITILDRARLEACACECYRVVNDAYARLFAG